MLKEIRVKSPTLVPFYRPPGLGHPPLPYSMEILCPRTSVRNIVKEAIENAFVRPFPDKYLSVCFFEGEWL